MRFYHENGYFLPLSEVFQEVAEAGMIAVEFFIPCKTF